MAGRQRSPGTRPVVRLTKIYTRGGDRGQTSLGDGSRVAKHNLRVAAYGTVDEANATIGLARTLADHCVAERPPRSRQFLLSG